ncbi:MAG: SurA N-terminal domain-containing protein [Candidatus Omnitrophica bacterium]|nr:SurA N-terminal domain-containing protein [Candidatus Omnitrophota bacterium]
MKRYLIIVVFLFLFFGCTKRNPDKLVIKINNFQMTAKEFEEEFREAGASILGPNNQKEKFLENLVNRKLILQEAENLGLNKDKEFLKSIERFYEQMLLKAVLDKKSNEFASKTQVNEQEIEAYYNELKEKGLIEKPLSEVYKEIKWQLLRQKQAQAFEQWVEGLRAKARIEIDKKALGLEGNAKSKMQNSK